MALGAISHASSADRLVFVALVGELICTAGTSAHVETYLDPSLPAFGTSKAGFAVKFAIAIAIALHLALVSIPARQEIREGSRRAVEISLTVNIGELE